MTFVSRATAEDLKEGAKSLARGRGSHATNLCDNVHEGPANLSDVSGCGLGLVEARVNDGEEGRLQCVAIFHAVPTQIRQNTSCAPFVVVDRSRLGNGPPQDSPVRRPNAIGWTVDLVDRLGMPNQHVPGLGPELEPILARAVFRQFRYVDVHEDGLRVDAIVAVRALEIDGSPIVLGRFVHGDPEANAFFWSDGAVLVVLVPLETFVGVHHEQVGRNTNLVRPSAAAEDVSHGRVVVKVGKSPVRLPHIALDVVIEFGGCASERPEVGVVHLIGGGFAQVFHPGLVEHAFDEDDAILFKSSDLLLGDFEGFRGSNALDNAVRERDLRVLQSKVVLPERRLFHHLSSGT